MSEFSRDDINQVLHAAGAALTRGHSHQNYVLLKTARHLALAADIDITSLSWYDFANGRV